MLRIEDDGVELHETNPDPDTGEQFLLRTYRDTHGITRTIAWRPDVRATWGSERLLFATVGMPL